MQDRKRDLFLSDYIRWLDKRSVRTKDYTHINKTRQKRSIPEKKNSPCPELDLQLMTKHIVTPGRDASQYNSAGTTIKVRKNGVGPF